MTYYGHRKEHREAALKARRNEVETLKTLKRYGKRNNFKALTKKGERFLELNDVLLCPKCGGHVWDVAKGHKLNKCWNCGLAFDSPEEEVELKREHFSNAPKKDINEGRTKLESIWFKGNVFSCNVDSTEMERKYAKKVKKPYAMETKEVNGVIYSRFYYKPIQPGEFWD